MSPLVRYTAAVLLTLICWRQTLLDGLAGNITLATAVTRFLVIFIAARMAMRFIGNLVDRYRATAPDLTQSAHFSGTQPDRKALSTRNPPDPRTTGDA